MVEKRMIYIVEDEPELRELLTEALDHVGYETRAAADGRTLLGLVSGGLPDLILMDIGLPDMSGWELQRQLQADLRRTNRTVPVIAVTGYGGASLEQTALQSLHFADYVRKPYSLADLVNRVERALGPSAEARHRL